LALLLVVVLKGRDRQAFEFYEAIIMLIRIVHLKFGEFIEVKIIVNCVNA
jgi:hypothetical protein